MEAKYVSWEKRALQEQIKIYGYEIIFLRFF